MASATLIPNVEFIFGLTGATASVLTAYILPAIVFLRLLDASGVAGTAPQRSRTHSAASGGGSEKAAGGGGAL
eukprot:74862-Chlamydomonas_euryale.AAC.1